MSKESKQILFEQIGAETQREGITKTKIRNAFTSLNEEKMENDGSNLTNAEIQSLQNVLGINQVASSRIVQIGPISTDEFSVTVGVFNNDYNQWIINNNTYQNFVNTILSVDELVNPTNLRTDSIYANTSNSFQILKGTEGESPVRPVNTNPDLLWVTDFLVTDAGINIENPPDVSGFVEKKEESWKEITLGISSDFVIDYSDERTRFKISSLGSAGHTLTGIVFSDDTERAVEFWVYNNTGEDININNVATSGLRKGFQVYGAPFKIIANGKALLKYNPATDIIECWKDNSTGGGISTVTTDNTLKGTGSPTEPLGLSDAKNAEIAGKISKQGINLGDTGNIPEMKTGDISGIYRGHGASRAVYDYSPFYQMSTANTFAQIHLRYEDGEMSYRAGNSDLGYSALRISWDTGNLVDPATQTWVNQQKGIANGFATLNDSGVVPSSQLPSYVDDVIEVTNYGALPTTGEAGKIYVILNASGGYQANQQFRWSGSGYIALVASPGTTDNVPEGTNNKYYTDARVGSYVATLGYATTSSVTTALNAKQDTSARVSTWSATTSNSNYPSEKLVKDSLDSKIDKVPGTGTRLAQINTDGSLGTAAPASNIPVQVYGIDSLNNFTKYPTTPFKSVNDLTTEPSPAVLESYSTDRVDFPNLQRIYFKVGNYWMYINLTQV